MKYIPKPTISVVCPTFNSENFIETTLKCIINQLRLPNELIISDDGSLDDTVQVVISFFKKYPNINVKIIENDHNGAGAARNRGIEKSTGEWIAFLDSDDYWLPEKLKIVEEHICNYPSFNFFCHNEIEKFLNGKERLFNFSYNYNPKIKLSKQLFNYNLFSPSAVTCKKELIIKGGLFNEQLSSLADYDMWLRMAPFIYPYFIDDVLGFYNHRRDNLSSTNWWKRYKESIKVFYYYRNLVTYHQFIYRFIRHSASFFKQLIYQYIFNEI